MTHGRMPQYSTHHHSMTVEKRAIMNGSVPRSLTKGKEESKKFIDSRFCVMGIGTL